VPLNARPVMVTAPVLESVTVTAVARLSEMAALVMVPVALLPPNAIVARVLAVIALVAKTAAPLFVNVKAVMALSVQPPPRVKLPAELSVTTNDVGAVEPVIVTVLAAVPAWESVITSALVPVAATTRVVVPVAEALVPVMLMAARAASAVLVTDNAPLPVLLAVKVAKAVPAKVLRVKPPAELSLMVNDVGVAKVVIVSVLVAVAEVESLMVTAPLKLSTIVAVVVLAAVLPVRLMVARLLEVMVPTVNAAPLVLLSVAVVRPAAVKPEVVNAPATVLVSFRVSAVIDASETRVAIVSEAARLSFTVSDVAPVVKAPVIVEATTEEPLAVTV